jgi:hypothetical protein
MKLAKWWIWAFGALVAAIVLVVVSRSRGERELVIVHLVDKQTGRPASVTVNVQEGRLYPVLSLFPFLPDRMRFSVKAFSIVARDGTFSIKRISKRGRRTFLTIAAEERGGGGQDIAYYYDGNGEMSLLHDYTTREMIKIRPDETEVWVPIDVVARTEKR